MKMSGNWELKYTHTNAEADDFTVYGHAPYARAIEQATQGRVKISFVRTEAGLASDRVWDDVKSGQTDISFIFTGLYPGQFSFIEVSTLPYLYPSASVGARVTWQLLEKYAAIPSQFKDVKVLAAWITEPYFIAGKSRFYKTLEDFPGQRIRAALGPPAKFVKALGANSVLVARNEVNQAFEQNEIDAALLPSEAYLTFRTYEAAPYITRVSTVATVNTLVMNLERWNSLPEAIQASIMSVSGEKASVQFGKEVFDRSHDKLLEVIRNSNGKIREYTPSEAYLQKMIERSGKPVWDNWVQAQKAAGLAEAQQILNEALELSKKWRAV